jgi:A/G-specific adenine glycosylase
MRGDILFLQKTAIKFFAHKGRIFPWRETNDPYVILVSELFLQKTTSKQVLEIFDDFFKTYPTIKSLAEANVKELEAKIKKLGLAKKASFLKEIAIAIMNTYDGKIPSDRGLLELKGVGMYTANATLCFAFNKKVPIIDTNIARLLRRYLGIKGDKPAYADKSLWKLAESILPEKRYKEFNYGLLDISAIYCRPKPLCRSCPLKTHCYYVTAS